MKKILMAVALCALSLAPAVAGTTSEHPVYIGENFAEGALKTARASSDSNQYIGCFTYQTRQADGGGIGVSCYARDSAGTYRSCVNDADTLLFQQARSLTYRSYLSFSWDRYGICTEIYVQNSSDVQ